MLIHKLKKLMKNQSGFSLIEIIIGITIMLIVIAALSGGLTVGIKTFQYDMAQNQNITSARSLANLIVEELRYATAKDIVISNGNIINYMVDNQPRKMYIGSGDDAKTLIVEYNQIITKKVAAKSLQDITFEKDNNKINISLQLNDNSYATSPDFKLTTITVVLQNM